MKWYDSSDSIGGQGCYNKVLPLITSLLLCSFQVILYFGKIKFFTRCPSVCVQDIITGRLKVSRGIKGFSNEDLQ